MTRGGNDSTDTLVVGLYLGFSMVACAVIVPLTVIVGFRLHAIIAGQTTGLPWVSVAVTPVALLERGILIAMLYLTIYTACRIISAISDGLFAQAIRAPDGRKVTGVFGLAATLFLVAVWTLPAWEPLIPVLAAIIAEAAPPTLPGNAHTFPAVVPVIGALYGYFVLTGRDSAVPETSACDSRTDTPGYAKVTTPTVPRTTRTTTIQSRGGGNRSEARYASGNSNAGFDDSNEAPATAADSPSQSETEGENGEDSTRSDTDSASDARAEFEREIREQAGANKRGAPADSGFSVDLDEYQFDWAWTTDVSMDDVGGLEDVKEELRRDVVRPMKEEPERAEKFDIPLPNVLLYGPPGTGKTYLAKALATELAFPFVSLSGSDVTSRWVNESSERVRQLFDEAQDLAAEVDGAVIFLDELDAVLPERRTESHGEDRKVVNEFLSRLQESARERVLFVGATNKRDDLDNAATRNGRIDKEIFVGEPDYETRVEMFKAQLDRRPHALGEKDIEKLAERTSGVVAADIEFLVNQAARNAAYGRDAERIEVKDIELQLD